MKVVLMLLTVSNITFAQTPNRVDPSTVGVLPNRGDSFQVEQSTQEMLRYCQSHHLANFGFDRETGHCNFDCTTSRLTCAENPRRISTKPPRQTRQSSIVRAIRPRHQAVPSNRR